MKDYTLAVQELQGGDVSEEYYDPEMMRAAGFTDRREGYWYYVTGVDEHTTLNITVNKATGAYTEHVLSEFDGQPEMYGCMIEPYRTDIREAIDAALGELREHGLKFSVDHALYGWGES